MFMLRNIFTAICRNPGRSLLLVAICFLLVCFTGVYFGSISNNERLLASLGEKLPVGATVTNASGAQQIGLAIQPGQVDSLLGMGIENPVLTAECYGSVDQSTLSDSTRISSAYIMAANSMDAFTIPADDIDMDAEALAALLAGSEGKCIVNSNYLRNISLDAKVGDVLDMYLHRPIYDANGYSFKFIQMGPAQLEIAGYFSSHVGTQYPDIICSDSWLRLQHEQYKHPFVYTSARCNVAEPLLLNDFKAAAMEQGFRQASAQAGSSRAGNTLVIEDSLFIESATQITRNIRTLRLFMLPVIILVILLVALVCFLLMRSRRHDISIARCLGRKKAAIAAEMLAEISLLALAGCLAALVVLAAAMGPDGKTCLLLLLGFMACQLAGAAVPVAILSRTNAMGLLARAE